MNEKNRLRIARGVVTAFAFLAGLAAAAAPPGPEAKPFADAHIVLQLSDSDDGVQNRVLNVAGNLLKHYGGPDRVDLEIVAFGPGISLLLAGSPHQERVSSLVSNGVRFVACLNTVDTIERTSGERPALNPDAYTVQAGVAHIVERSTQGYTLVRP